MFSLTIISRDGSSEVQNFDQHEVTIGRSPNNDVVLPQASISQTHMRIVQRDNTISVIDNQSTNGTSVNGKRISETHVLRPGDKIYVSDYVIKVAALEGRVDTGTQRTNKPAPRAVAGGANPMLRTQRLQDLDLDEPETEHVSAKVNKPKPKPATRSSTDDEWDLKSGVQPNDPFEEDEAPPPPIRTAPQALNDFDDDWEVQSAAKPAPAGSSSKPAATTKPAPAPAPVAAAVHKPAVVAAVAHGAPLADLLQRYVEIEEFHYVKVHGRKCECGVCLLCEAKAALVSAKRN